MGRSRDRWDDAVRSDAIDLLQGSGRKQHETESGEPLVFGEALARKRAETPWEEEEEEEKKKKGKKSVAKFI